MNENFDPKILPKDEFGLVKIAIKYCRLPNVKVVNDIKNPVFPTIRNTKKRLTIETIRGRSIMFDDNTTPRWALLWAHGYKKTDHPKGWTFAHVWDESQDPDAYTHLANLVMIPECLASLTDKQGPLVPYLRYHSQSCYEWLPEGKSEIEKPKRYDQIEWNYLESISDPGDVVHAQLIRLNNQRVIKIRDTLGIQP